MPYYRKTIPALTVFCIGVLFPSVLCARVTHPVDAAYEDTVRIVVLWNNARGICTEMPPVGPQTRDFIIEALDTSYCAEVKIVQDAEFEVQGNGWPGNVVSYARLVNIVSLWPGKLPHVIVHANAGWGIYNGPALESVLTWAVDNNIGIVSIGDDGMYQTTSVFGWQIAPAMTSLYTGLFLKRDGDSMWVALEPSKDNLVDSAAYPHLNGIVRNAASMADDNANLYFKPVLGADPRCESDPDSVTLLPAAIDDISYLGYQQGYNAAYDTGEAFPFGWGDGDTREGLVAKPGQYNVISTYEKATTTIDGVSLRRAVYLGFQPQFLKNRNAALQLVYDAIMYASLSYSAISTGINKSAAKGDRTDSPVSVTLMRNARQNSDIRITLQKDMRAINLQLFNANGTLIAGQSLSSLAAGTHTVALASEGSARSICILRLAGTDMHGAQTRSTVNLVR